MQDIDRMKYDTIVKALMEIDRDDEAWWIGKIEWEAEDVWYWIDGNWHFK